MAEKKGVREAPRIGLPFERPIVELELKIGELKSLSESTGMNLNGELKPLMEKLERMTREIYAGLEPYDIVQIARHPLRPQTSDYIAGMLDEYVELHGDRRFGDDRAITTGFARIGEHRFLLLGHRKGKETKENIACNWGCAHPEGYRKALHKMRLAEKFGLPIVTLINTPGAYPGVGAEERGQAWAIAENIMVMSRLKTPIICIVIGEGGSGGALRPSPPAPSHLLRPRGGPARSLEWQPAWPRPPRSSSFSPSPWRPGTTARSRGSGSTRTPSPR